MKQEKKKWVTHLSLYGDKPRAIGYCGARYETDKKPRPVYTSGVDLVDCQECLVALKAVKAP